MGDIVITPASNDVNSTAGTLNIRTSDSYPMLLKTSNVERISITAAGLVGIGTTAPTGKLHIYSSITGDTLLRADGTNGTIFSVTDDLSNSLLSVNNSAGIPVLEVFADDSVVMGQYGSGDFVLRNNKIGIGTTNPINKLSVIGSASIGSAGYNVNAPSNGLIVEGTVGIGITNPNTNYKLDLSSANDGYARQWIASTAFVGTDNGTNGFQIRVLGGGTNGLKISNSVNNVEYVRISSDGKVGIGTIAPTGFLTIQANSDQLRLQTADGPGSFYTYISSLYDSSHPFSISVANNSLSAAVYFAVYADAGGANNRIALLNGNVGIGTSNAQSKLDVRGTLSIYQSANSDYMYFDHQGVTTWRTRITTDNTSTYIIGRDTPGVPLGSKILAITLDGKLGIGTISPTTLLGVGPAGSTSAASGITFGGDAQANLYRVGEDSIKTDGSLHVAGSKYFNGFQSAYIIARGTGLNNNAGRYLAINGTTIYSAASGRGLRLTIINATNLTVLSSTDYDTLGGDAACDDLAAAINGMTSQQIGVLTSFDAWERDRASLRTAALNVGLTKLGTYSTGGAVRKPYAAIFNGTSDTANATTKHVIERMESSDADASRVLISTYITTDTAYAAIDGALHMPNALYASDADIEYPILLVDSVGRVGIGTTVPSGTLNIISRGSVGFVPTTTGPIGGSINTRVHIQGAEPGLMLSSDIHPVTGIQTNTQAYQLGLQIGYYAANDVRNQIYFGNGPLTFTYSANQGVAVTERMRIDTAGRVGIGTTSALAQLHVTGQTYLTNVVDSVARNQLTINANGANYAHFYDVGVSANNAIALGGNGAIGTVPTKAIMSWRLSTENVGIGLTNPEATSALHIKNLDAAAKVTIESADGSESLINFSAQASEYSVGFVRDGSNVNSLRFCAADSLSANEVMRLQNTNVGIGTNNPIFGLDVYKDTFRSLSRVSEKIITVSFPHAVANQKVDIVFNVTPGAVVFWGNLEVEITDGYSDQLATGKLIKVFALGLNPATGSGPYAASLYDNTSYYTAAYGAVADNYAIDGIFFNTTTGKYYFTIIHRTSTGNVPAIKIKGFTVDVTRSVNINSLTAGTVYTTNTTVYYKPVVETLQSRIGFNGNIDQSADLLVRGLVGLGTTNPSSRLVLGSNFASVSGITVSTDNFLESQFVARKAASKCAFGVLAWEAEAYLSAGIYYNNGNWQQHNANNNNLLFVLVPGGGVNWYASNNGSPSWNVVEALNLWDQAGRWKSSIQSTRAEDSYILNGKFGIGTSSPTTLLSVGPAGSTTAASGITFGGDAQANLYRVTEDTIRTDGSFIAVGSLDVGNGITSSSQFRLGTYLGYVATFPSIATAAYRWIILGPYNDTLTVAGNGLRVRGELFFSRGSNGENLRNARVKVCIGQGYNKDLLHADVLSIDSDSTTEQPILYSVYLNGFTSKYFAIDASQLVSFSPSSLDAATVYYNGQFYDQSNDARSLTIQANTSITGAIGVVSRGGKIANALFAYTGNIGIGIAVPSAKLEVNGPVFIPSTNGLYLGGTAGSFSSWQSIQYANGGYHVISSNGLIINNAGYSASPINAFTILTNTYDVGLSTNAPAERLHVYKTGLANNSTNSLLLLDGKFTAAGVDSDDIVGIAFRVENASGGAQRTTSIASSYQAGGYNALLLQHQGGNVGIGTTNPTYPLHVANTSIYHVTAEQTKTNTGDANAYATFYVLNNAGTSQLRGYLGAGGASVGNTAMQNHVYIGAQSNHGLRFFTNDTAKVTIQAGGNVGIGTTNPAFKLDVLGDLRVSGTTSTVGTFRSSATSCFISLIDSSNDNVFLGNDDGDFLIQTPTTSYSTKLIVKDGGNVGIGTDNPTAKLVVMGEDIQNYAKSSVPTAIIADSVPEFLIGSTDNIDGEEITLRMGSVLSSFYTYGAYVKAIQGAGVDYYKLAFGTSNGAAATTKMTIANDGNVGIGTTNPLAPLHVGLGGDWPSSTGTSAMVFIKQKSSNVGLVIQEPGNASFDRALHLYTNGSLATIDATYRDTGPYPDIAFVTSGTVRARINSDGKVGIGTNSPYSLLDVQVASASPRYVTISTNDGQGSYYGFGLNFRIADNAHDIGQIRGVYENSNGGGFGGLAIATRFGGTLYDRVTFTDQGRVGIGMTNPTTLLSVGGAGSTTAASGITFGADSQANLYRISASRIKTDGFLTIDGGGGGGATNLLLNRSSSSNENGMAFTTAGSVDWYYYVDNGTTNLQIQRGTEIDSAPRVRFNGANSDILFNLGGGNIGVGTATPTGKLHIYSTITGQTLIRADGTNGTIFSVVDDLSNSLLSVNNSAGIPVLEVFADDSIVMGQYGSGDLVVASNKVGIGTTNPNFKLTVNGDINILGTTNKIKFNGVDVVNTAGGGNGDMYLNCRVIRAESNNYNDGMFIGYNSAGTTSAHLRFYANGGTERMRIQANNGFVGIGTDTAAGRLDVYASGDAENAVFIRNLSAGANAHSVLVLRRDGNTNGLAMFTNSSTRTADGGAGNSTIRADTNKLLLGAGGVTYHSLETNGNVGIGLTNPSAARLHIKGDTTNPVIRVETNSIEGPAGGTAGRTLRGWLPIMTGANATDKVYIPLFGPLN